MPEAHVPFPLGVWCSHHSVWHKLGDAIVHRKLSHGNCELCRLEAELADELLDEAKAAAAQVREAWRA